MVEKTKFFIEIHDANWMTYYRRLNPTGRWKITTGINDKCSLFIEHKGPLWFKSWVHESYIIEGYPITEKIFNC